MSSANLRGLKAALTACVFLSGMLLGAPDAFAQKGAKSQKVPQNFSIVPIDITSVTVENGQLVAHGLVGTHPFSSPLTVGSHAGNAHSQNVPACAILDLSLGPIDLNLLGLRVQTSPICLQINAYEGGGLLGDLLCSVANLLESGVPLSDVLAILQGQNELTRFLNSITSLLNGALDQVVSNHVGDQPSGAIAASCTVLDLSLGPVNLNLLGLEVILDNCNGGPVTVTITAIPGGGLLGDLLCSLSNLLNGGIGGTALQTVLWQITRVLGGLLG